MEESQTWGLQSSLDCNQGLASSHRWQQKPLVSKDSFLKLLLASFSKKTLKPSNNQSQENVADLSTLILHIPGVYTQGDFGLLTKQDRSITEEGKQNKICLAEVNEHSSYVAHSNALVWQTVERKQRSSSLH